MGNIFKIAIFDYINLTLSCDMLRLLHENRDCHNLRTSYHKHNLKPIHADYIYRIIACKMQKGKPYEMDLPY